MTMIGVKSGKLTVISEDKVKVLPSGQKPKVLTCKCECGNTKDVLKLHFVRGLIQSCGCIKRVRNGESHSRLFKVWKSMFERTAKNAIDSHRYFDRGISVCDAWNDYFVFREWALSNGYSDSLTIDRINNSLGYSPDNCRFVTMVENANNRDATKFVTYHGEKMPFSMALRKAGKLDKYNVIFDRISRGWGADKAIDTPSRPLKRTKPI